MPISLKYPMFLSIVIALFLSCASAPAAVSNLIPNSDFRKLHNSIPVGWSHPEVLEDLPGVSPSVLGVRRVKGREGLFLKVLGGQDRAGQWSCSVAGIVPNAEYRFEVDIVRFRAVNGMYPRVRLFGREYLLDAVWFSKYEHHVVLTADSGEIEGRAEIVLMNDNPTPMYFRNPRLVRIADGTGYGVPGNPPSRILESKAGFRNVQLPEPLNSRIPESPNPRILESQNFRIPKFPLGLYGTKPEDLAAIDDSPFNIVRVPATPEAVAAAHARGLDVFCSMPSDADKVAALAATFQEAGVSFSPRDLHYIDDEPELRSIDPEHLRDKRRVLAEHWPHVRGFMANVRPWAVARYMDAAEIFGMDQYPVPSQPMTWLSRSIDQADTLIRGRSKEVWAIIQAFGGESAAKHGWPAFPSYEQMRCLTFLSLLHGVDGLFYFTYSDVKKDPKRWQDLKNIGNQVRSIEPWLTAAGKFAPLPVHVDSRFKVDADGTPAVHAGVKTVNGKRLVVVVNVINRAVDVEVGVGRSLMGAGKETLSAPFAGTVAVVRDGGVYLHLEPHEVRVLVDDGGSLNWRGGRAGLGNPTWKLRMVAAAPVREWGPSR